MPEDQFGVLGGSDTVFTTSSKIIVPQNSNFDSQRAIELANLIERAYQQYDTDQDGKKWPPEESKKLTGSNNCTNDLSEDNLPLKYTLLSTFRFTGFWNLFMETVTFGFIAKREDENSLFIVFRGTREKQEWWRNFDFGQREFLGKTDLGFVSKGFQIMYSRSIQKRDCYFEQFNDNNELESIRDPKIDLIFQKNGYSEAIAKTVERTLNENLKEKKINEETKIFITGHSLGGALGTLAMLQVTTQTNFKPILYTFASPRTGNPNFANNFGDLECYRIANSEDIVPTLPFPVAKRRVGEADFAKMSFQQRNGVESLRMFISSLTGKLTDQVYQHVGEPLYFTTQKGSISENHNLSRTYRKAIADFI